MKLRTAHLDEGATMRRGTRFSSLLLVLLLSGAILPRSGVAQALYVGARMGGSFTTFGGDAAEGLESSRGGLVVGGLVRWRVHDRLTIQSEPAWVQKGARGSLVGFEEPIAVDLRLDYVEIPLLVRVSMATPIPLRPTVSAGGAVSFETGCSVRTNPEELALTFGCGYTQQGNRRRTTDWSLVFGSGIEYDVGSTSLSLNGRYSLGLVEVGNVAGLRNRGGTVALGFVVPLRW